MTGPRIEPRIWITLVGASALLVAVSACGDAGLPVPEGISTQSNDGTYHVVYTTDPDPIPVNDPFTMDVHVRDGSDPRRVVPDVTLNADAAMPTHRHGMIQVPEVKALGEGRFRVRGMLFHMSGPWELYLDVTRDGITERAQFDVNLE